MTVETKILHDACKSIGDKIGLYKWATTFRVYKRQFWNADIL